MHSRVRECTRIIQASTADATVTVLFKHNYLIIYAKSALRTDRRRKRRPTCRSGRSGSGTILSRISARVCAFMYTVLLCMQCLNKFKGSSTAVVLVELLVRGHHLLQKVFVEREARHRGKKPAKVLASARSEYKYFVWVSFVHILYVPMPKSNKYASARVRLMNRACLQPPAAWHPHESIQLSIQKQENRSHRANGERTSSRRAQSPARCRSASRRRP